MSVCEIPKRGDVASPPPIQLVTLPSKPASPPLTTTHSEIGRDFFSAEYELAKMRHARQQQKRQQQSNANQTESNTTKIDVHMVEIPVATNTPQDSYPSPRINSPTNSNSTINKNGFTNISNISITTKPSSSSSPSDMFADVNRDFLDAETELMRLRLSRANNKKTLTSTTDIKKGLPDLIIPMYPHDSVQPSLVDRDFADAQKQLSALRASTLRRDYWDVPIDRDFATAAESYRELRFQGDDVVDRDYAIAARDRSASTAGTSFGEDRDFVQAERDLRNLRSSATVVPSSARFMLSHSNVDDLNHIHGLDRHYGTAELELSRYRLSMRPSPRPFASIDAPLDRSFDTAASDLAHHRKKPQLSPTNFQQQQQHQHQLQLQHTSVDRDFNVASRDRLSFISHDHKTGSLYHSADRDFKSAEIELAAFRSNQGAQVSLSSSSRVSTTKDSSMSSKCALDEPSVMGRDILAAEAELAQLRNKRTKVEKDSQVSSSLPLSPYCDSLDRNFAVAAFDMASSRLQTGSHADSSIDRDFETASLDLEAFRFGSDRSVDRDYRTSKTDRALMEFNRSTDIHDRDFVGASIDRAKIQPTMIAKKNSETSEKSCGDAGINFVDDRDYLTAARELALLRA